MRGYLQYDVQKKKKKREVQRMLGLVEQWKLLEGGVISSCYALFRGTPICTLLEPIFHL